MIEKKQRSNWFVAVIFILILSCLEIPFLFFVVFSNILNHLTDKLSLQQFNFIFTYYTISLILWLFIYIISKFICKFFIITEKNKIIFITSSVVYLLVTSLLVLELAISPISHLNIESLINIFFVPVIITAIFYLFSQFSFRNNADIDTSNENIQKQQRYGIIKKIIMLTVFLLLFLPYPSSSLNMATGRYDYITPVINALEYLTKITRSPNSCIDCTAKPVLYLYPENKQDILVQLNYQGNITVDYPKYNENINGWNVTAYPDGRIINKNDGLEYSYIFWEGMPKINPKYDLSRGFIVKGEDTQKFLQDTLSKMGLTPKEYNEFIVYWYPRMKDNKYNLIHFADTGYTNIAKLSITPNPDSMLRVFMVFRPIDKKIEITSQEIKPFERRGFTVIEWGGSELK